MQKPTLDDLFDEDDGPIDGAADSQESAEALAASAAMQKSAPVIQASLDETSVTSGTVSVPLVLDGSQVQAVDFDKLKKAELAAFYEEHAPEHEMSPAEFKKLTVPVMKQTLKHLFPDTMSLTSPLVTGFDAADPIQGTIAQVQALPNEQAAIDYIHSLDEENQFNFFCMGGALYEMQNKQWQLDYDSFGDFVEAEFGFKERKAKYLISIYFALASCECKWTDVKDIGWSKLAIVAPHMNPDNYKWWLATISAPGLTFLDVQDIIKTWKNGDGEVVAAESSSPAKVFKVHVHEDQLDTIRLALDKAKEAGNTEFDGPALEYMSLDYLAGPDAAAAKANAPAPEVTAENLDSVILNVIQTAAKNAEEPLDGLTYLLNAINDYYQGNEFPDLDFDVYPDGKPDPELDFNEEA